MPSSLWWERPDLGYTEGSLTLSGRDLHDLALSMGTPLFVYSAGRIRHNLERLHGALATSGVPFTVYYAMKANRFQPLLTFLQSTGRCGVDACSPEEVRLARSCGFSSEHISLTATALSAGEIDRLLGHEGLVITCDSITMIRHIGTRCPGREIGIRLNPGLGVGYGQEERLRYSGGRTTKFGIYAEQMDEAVKTAETYGLSITHIHVHTGCGYLSDQLDTWGRIIDTCLAAARPLDRLQTINLGGGLGLPHTAEDRALDLSAWAGVIRSRLAGTGLAVAVEPGDFIVKDSGILLLDITLVEQKKDRMFVGVNGGFNLAMEPAFYNLPCEPALCRPRTDREAVPVTVAGNINEALDVWADDHLMPLPSVGDVLALINAGGYASAMSSNHCLRGAFHEMLLPPSPQTTARPA
ncbi:diaminopimelate decarboxylase [Desulfatiferula olefinivorans]